MSMGNVSLPTEETEKTTIEQVNAAIARAKEEHKQILDEITEARQWQEQRDKRMLALQDHEAYLAKEQKRLQEWDAQVLAREQAVKVKEDGTKHYTLQADTGVITGVFN